MKPIIENHGKVFGSKNWYLFYCGNCRRTINMNKSPRLTNCEYCNERVDWNDNVTCDNTMLSR
jgi:uncharacterized CHY-type Zn-finger protein